MNFSSLLPGLRSVQMDRCLSASLAIVIRRISVVLSLTQLSPLNRWHHLRVDEIFLNKLRLPTLHLRILKAKLLIIHHRIRIFLGRNHRGVGLLLLQLLIAPIPPHGIRVDAAVVDSLRLLLLFGVLEHVVVGYLVEGNIGLLTAIPRHLLIILISLHPLVLSDSSLSIL